MSTFILPVHSATDNDEVIPTHFFINLSESIIERIKKLQKSTLSLECHSIRDFYSEGVYFSSDHLPKSIEQYEDDHASLSKDLAEFECAKYNMDIKMLIVTQEGFRFTATPKHQGDECACSTSKVRISNLQYVK